MERGWLESPRCNVDAGTIAHFPFEYSVVVSQIIIGVVSRCCCRRWDGQSKGQLLALSRVPTKGGSTYYVGGTYWPVLRTLGSCDYLQAISIGVIIAAQNSKYVKEFSFIKDCTYHVVILLRTRCGDLCSYSNLFFLYVHTSRLRIALCRKADPT
jgi:hypothetical protein